MWDLLDKRAPSAHATADLEQLDAADAPAPAAASSSSCASAQPLARRLKGNALRQALSKSERASDLNLVLHPGYTEQDARRLRLEEECK
eukprot:6181544-Pleurochrysis_carterae.AAC.1